MTAEEIRIAVVADTHVPDRVRSLHPDLLPRLRELSPQMILHAGDICSPLVLEQLGSIAPVRAVRGNRDWAFIGRLPWQVELEISGVKIALMHGMGSWGKYLEFKIRYAKDPYRLEKYLPILKKAAPDADVIVFGHTHSPEILQLEHTLILNPGSASVPPPHLQKPTFGVLRLSPNGWVKAEIQELPAWTHKK